MRLWSLHPKYLDKHGLIAVWREGLLAQKVLTGEVQAYQNHPQLERFKKFENPVKAIGSYLSYIAAEGSKRGYKLTHEKILYPNFEQEVMAVNDGQLIFEMKHLQNKLKARDKTKLKDIKAVAEVEPNPMFDTETGGKMLWEKNKTIN